MTIFILEMNRKEKETEFRIEIAKIARSFHAATLIN